MQIRPYLNFNGNCADAFRFYEQCFGGKITMMMTHAESPMKDHVAPEWRGKVLHATLVVGDMLVMGSDAPPPHYAAPQGMYVSIHPESQAEAARIFAALAEGGKVSMPLGPTFWSPSFGMTVDRFGIPWMINYEPPA